MVEGPMNFSSTVRLSFEPHAVYFWQALSGLRKPQKQQQEKKSAKATAAPSARRR